ncbi:YhgE/Pip domain-containing protein [Candidatus Saccharibacteria bacterium]|nr:YhgE/Pip domain-containing protein [Candidatus Saccharibacteria bacterium]
MAILIVFGVIFIPGIYAWLNIDSNWNPYDNTENIPIAVVNEDQGTTIIGEDLNIGNQITDALQQNDAMKWTFTDETTALEGVNQSSFYGAIIIPKDFSQNLTTILGDTTLQKPTFNFYVNNKKNPIAPIIVSKAAGAIKDSANQAFTNTLLYKIADATEKIGLITKGNNTADSLIAKLQDTKTKVGQLRDITRTTTLALDTTSKSLSTLESVFPILSDLNATASQDLIYAQNTLDTIHNFTDLSSVQDLLTQLSDQITELESIQQLLNAILPSSAELDAVKAKLQTTIDEISSLHDQFQTSARTELDQLYQKATHTISEANNLISNLTTTLSDLEISMQYAVQALQSGSQLGSSLDSTLATFQTDLDSAINQINSIKDSEVIQTLTNLLSNDPEIIANFLSNPVESNEIAVYAIADYGSEMAPFYSILACWVGCTILTAILKIDIKKSKLTAKAKNYQKFFGRFLLFGSIAMLQGLVIGLGDLVLQVQTVNLPLFLITLMLSSLTFVLIIYALTAAFGKVGQALSIVILVLQVAGSGGTFPIELLPKFFQTLQPFMPFYPSMNAIRETIGGFYQNDYLIYLLILLCHFIIALVFGLIFSKHTFTAKGKIQQELHSTGLID